MDLIARSSRGLRYVPHTLTIPSRRAVGRRPDAGCRTCDRSHVQTVFRTEMAVYFRCLSCNRVWGEPKPPAAKTIQDAFQALTGLLNLDAGRIF